MSPEQEAEVFKQQVAAAQASGDISSLLRLMTSTAEQKPSDFIKKTIGNILFIYYLYIDNLHTRPTDMLDLVDGLLYLDARNYLEKKQLEEIRQRNDRAGSH